MAEALDATFARFREEHQRLSEALSDSSLFDNPKAAAELSRQHRRLDELLTAYDERARLGRQILENTELSHDPTLAEMVAADNAELQPKVAALDAALEELLLPRDPDEGRNAILEIRAGTGGDEAELFAAELYRMYSRYAEGRGWKIEIDNLNQSELGGIKEVIATISGDEVFRFLQFESGVHRVQRVPETEKAGRIHTSAATVAILPEAEETDIQLPDADLRIDVYRSSGHGGQSVNTTDSAVRVTHLPTGMIVTCQDEKSQHKNKAKALGVLRSRLYELERQKKQSERSEARLSQIGSGDRSEKIRTYNYPQDRVTDHRVNQSWSNLPGVLGGTLGPILDSLLNAQREHLKSQRLIPA
jgi:peptide chain release factor 1